MRRARSIFRLKIVSSVALACMPAIRERFPGNFLILKRGEALPGIMDDIEIKKIIFRRL